MVTQYPGITSAASHQRGHETKAEGIFGEVVSLPMLASVLCNCLYPYLPGFFSHGPDS